LRARGVWRGIGISGYVEGTAIGPFEGARVTLDAAGRVRVATGAVCSGQGHETSFAQVAADALGVPLDWVTVTGGDTAGVPFGIGTFASRSGVTAGNSIADAAGQVRAKVLAAAGALLEAAPEDLEIEDGRGFVRGAPSSAVDFARVVPAASPRVWAARCSRTWRTTPRGSCWPAVSWTTRCRPRATCRRSRRSTWNSPRRVTRSA